MSLALIYAAPVYSNMFCCGLFERNRSSTYRLGKRLLSTQKTTDCHISERVDLSYPLRMGQRRNDGGTLHRHAQETPKQACRPRCFEIQNTATVLGSSKDNNDMNDR